MRVGGRTAALIIAYALLSILVVPIYPHFISANEFSRWMLAVAIVDFHTVEVSPVIKATGVRNEDLATVDGRVYSNKAPGGTLVGLPAYAIARAIGGPPSPHNLRATLNAMRLLASTVPTLLLVLFWAMTAQRFGCRENRVTFAAAAMLFGTPLFAYGLLFFAHALSAFTLFGAFALLFDEPAPRGDSWRTTSAGALIGLAVLSEYPSAIPAAVLMACSFPRLGIKGLLRVIAGGLPFAAVLGLYNRIAFGTVLTLSSAHESEPLFRDVAKSGLFGVGLPSPMILLHLLFDPAKGLFVFSPVLLLALLGVRAAYRALPRSAFVALIATPLSILLTFGGYANWHGGWTVGARYLVPAIPFLTLFIAFAAETSLDALLLGSSAAATAIVSLVFPFVGTDYPAPWVSFSWPILRDGHVVPNVLHFISRPLAIAVPFAIVVIAVFVAVPRRAVVITVAGAALWFAVGVAIEGLRDHPPNIRAVVEEVNFEDRGAIRRTLGANHPNVVRLEAIARRMEKSPPDFWPF